jgi:hypothetical protein
MLEIIIRWKKFDADWLSISVGGFEMSQTFI